MTADAETGADMWLNSDDNIPENFERSLEFHEKRQKWLWRHSIDTCKEEFSMPFVVFRFTDNGIEISWNNNAHNFTRAEFRYNCGWSLFRADRVQVGNKSFYREF